MDEFLLSARGLRGLKVADLAMPPGITLVAGLNEQGKTSILQALAAALSGEPRICGVAKKDFREVLIHSGQKRATATVSTPSGTLTLVWPEGHQQQRHPSHGLRCGLGRR